MDLFEMREALEKAREELFDKKTNNIDHITEAEMDNSDKMVLLLSMIATELVHQGEKIDGLTDRFDQFLAERAVEAESLRAP